MVVSRMQRAQTFKTVRTPDDRFRGVFACRSIIKAELTARYAIAGIALIIMSSSALAGAGVTNRYHLTVDGQKLRVVTFADNSVRVVLDSTFGPNVSVALRDKMRRAVSLATNCRIADDFWIDAKLNGRLECDPASTSPQEAVGQNDAH